MTTIQKNNEQREFARKQEEAFKRIEKKRQTRAKSQLAISLTRGAKSRIQKAISSLSDEERRNAKNNVRKISQAVAMSLYNDHCNNESEDNQTLEYQADRQHFATFFDIEDHVEYYLNQYGSK